MRFSFLATTLQVATYQYFLIRPHNASDLVQRALLATRHVVFALASGDIVQEVAHHVSAVVGEIDFRMKL